MATELEGALTTFCYKVILLGNYGVGKTTLLRRLKGKNTETFSRDRAELLDSLGDTSKLSRSSALFLEKVSVFFPFSFLQSVVLPSPYFPTKITLQ